MQQCVYEGIMVLFDPFEFICLFFYRNVNPLRFGLQSNATAHKKFFLSHNCYQNGAIMEEDGNSIMLNFKLLTLNIT